MKKIFIKFILLILMSGSGLTGFAFSLPGEGTGSNPYQIRTEAELDTVLNGIGGYSMSGKVFVLMNDINITNRNWSSVGNYTFDGILDGNNFTIRFEVAPYAGGLISHTLNAEVKNLIVNGNGNTFYPNIYGAFGLLVSYADGGLIIENCRTVDATTVFSLISQKAGGLVGWATVSSPVSLMKFSIKDSYSNVLLAEWNNGYREVASEVGGLVGCIDGYREVEIRNSMYRSERLSSIDFAGGLVGQITADQVVIDHSYASTYILNKGSAGGLVGRVNGRINITESAFEGTVFVNEANNSGIAGGLIGQLYSDDINNTITRSYTKGEVMVYRVNNGNIGLGGLVGLIESPSLTGKTEIAECFSASKLTAALSKPDLFHVGGLVGSAKNTSTVLHELSIKNSYYDGISIWVFVDRPVAGLAYFLPSYTGGLVGEMTRGEIRDSYAVFTKPLYVAPAGLRSCAYSEGSAVGGLVGLARESKIYNSFFVGLGNEEKNYLEVETGSYIGRVNDIYVGGLVGHSIGTGIGNSFVLANGIYTRDVIEETVDRVNIGGIAGKMEGGNIRSCQVSGNGYSTLQTDNFMNIQGLDYYGQSLPDSRVRYGRIAGEYVSGSLGNNYVPQEGQPFVSVGLGGRNDLFGFNDHGDKNGGQWTPGQYIPLLIPDSVPYLKSRKNWNYDSIWYASSEELGYAIPQLQFEPALEPSVFLIKGAHQLFPSSYPESDTVYVDPIAADGFYFDGYRWDFGKEDAHSALPIVSNSGIFPENPIRMSQQVFPVYPWIETTYSFTVNTYKEGMANRVYYFEIGKLEVSDSNRIHLLSHLQLRTSQNNYYAVEADQIFRVLVDASSPEVRVGLFSLNGNFMEDLTQSVSGKVHTCKVSPNVYSNSYMIQPYYTDYAGIIQLVERPAGSMIMDKLPLNITDDWWRFSTASDFILSRSLQIRTAESYLHSVTPGESFRVMVDTELTGSDYSGAPRMGLFELTGNFIADITVSVSGKTYTCRVPSSVYGGNYMILPFYQSDQGEIVVIERLTGEPIMDRLPLAVTDDWGRSLKNFAGADPNQPEINLYPNPTPDIVNIGTTESLVKVEIYDINGGLVLKSTEPVISIARLPVGVYVVKVETEAGIAIQKIRKE